MKKYFYTILTMSVYLLSFTSALALSLVPLQKNGIIESLSYTRDYFALSTTTGFYPLTIASSTAPQLALSAGAGLSQWVFRNAGGNLYFSTTTVAGTATTSTPALTIIGATGSIGIASSSPTTPFSVQTNHASNIGGIDLLVGDINTPSPILISHKNSTTQGSLTLLGFNVYNNPAGSTVVYNGSSAGFVFQSDARSTASPSLQLNAISTGGASTNIFTSTQGGLFGIATTGPWRTLSVVGTVAFNGLTTSTAGNAVCILGTFDVVTAGNTTCITSSKYTKDNITNITDEEAMVISKMRAVKYTMKSTGEWRYGFIAEEVEKLDPLLIERAKQDINIDGHLFKKGDVLSFDYLRYSALLTRYTQIIAEKNGVPQGKSNTQLWYIIVIFAFIYQQIQIIKLKK